ncbi:MAG TPA: sigma-70 family RNA polymerase sigma factor [Methylomirabilota bacterium]|nr:sigma-70 family RNA polymerase sigma factor [Methylomirabilota bacterium]
MTDDNQLLERFATGGDEDAFRELIERHLNLVYSAALRRVNGDAPLAEDVAQTVFTDLARKARSLPRDVLLTGWLYEAVRFAATSAIRGERRRQTREQEAMTMQHLASESTPGWEQLSPVLDDAMGDLCAADRNAILLRYFKNQDFQAVGLALGVSDAAAQKRVSRAVERLREFFAKRGVTVGASGLILVISANSVQAAPMGLSNAIATTATATAAKAIVMTATHKTLIAIITFAAVGTGIYAVREGLRNPASAGQSRSPSLAARPGTVIAPGSALPGQTLPAFEDRSTPLGAMRFLAHALDEFDHTNVAASVHGLNPLQARFVDGIAEMVRVEGTMRRALNGRFGTNATSFLPPRPLFSMSFAKETIDSAQAEIQSTNAIVLMPGRNGRVDEFRMAKIGGVWKFTGGKTDATERGTDNLDG